MDGINTGGYANLYFIQNGVLIARRYVDKILQHIGLSYEAKVEENFLFVDDNVRLHQENHQLDEVRIERLARKLS